MNRKKLFFSLCASILIGAAYAYDKGLTQQLQDKINGTQSELELANPVMLKELEQLIIKGADPNAAHKADPAATLVLLLCILPFIDDAIDIAAVEHTLKVALEHGGNANAREERAPALQYAMAGSPGMVTLLIDHGADLTIKNKNGDTPLAIVEKEIEGRKEGLAYLQQKEIPKMRTENTRMQQEIDALKSMRDHDQQDIASREQQLKAHSESLQRMIQKDVPDLEKKIRHLQQVRDVIQQALKAQNK